MSNDAAGPVRKEKKQSKKRKLVTEPESEVAAAPLDELDVQIDGSEESRAASRAAVNDEMELQEEGVSHAEQRKRRKLEKKKQKGGIVDEGAEESKEETDKPEQKDAETAANKDANREKRSGHGVWVGNLSFKTDGDKLRKFFAPCGSITRLHMPKGAQKLALNKGFAYVDFEDPVGVTTAVSMSEGNLDGRRLLIKDSKSFEGRPKNVATEAIANATAQSGAGEGDKSLSKTARKILDRQKNPPAPTLFVGNLGFETTVEMIQEAVEAHFQSAQAWLKKDKKERKKGGKGKAKPNASDSDEDDEEDEDQDASDAAESAGDAESSSGGEQEVEEEVKPELPKPKPKANAGIRKVRIGTFEDTGKCKGWAFIDFHTTLQSTSALINGRNHYLNGRALTLEFASADAVRRGGGRMDGAPSVSAPSGRGGSAGRGGRGGASFVHPSRRPRVEYDEDAQEPAANANEYDPATKQGFYRPPLAQNPFATTEATNAAAAIIQAGGKVHKPNKAERKVLRDQKAKGDRNDTKRRVKPGAALADAKREKMAIVPGQGKKMVFE